MEVAGGGPPPLVVSVGVVPVSVLPPPVRILLPLRPTLTVVVLGARSPPLLAAAASEHYKVVLFLLGRRPRQEGQASEPVLDSISALQEAVLLLERLGIALDRAGRGQGVPATLPVFPEKKILNDNFRLCDRR